MSDLDQAMAEAERDIQQLSEKKYYVRADQKRRRSWLLPVLVILIIVLSFQVKILTQWVLGVPDDTIQSDIVTLLTTTDKRLQTLKSQRGELPDSLPEDMPQWLIGYKKTLAGYKINVEINGVVVELENNDGVVTINHPN